MIFRRMLLLVTLLSTTAGCYWGISGTVIDASTKQPIEGAIVLAQWTKTHGLGLTYNSVYKIVETETDKSGKFSLPGAYSPFVDDPILVIYKRGYVAWRNDYMFPSLEKRTQDTLWKTRLVYQLDGFTAEYSKNNHHSFLSLGIIGSELAITPKYMAAESYELRRALDEIEKERRRGK